MKVVIVGTGNVAAVLGRKMKEGGAEIVQVAGRNRVKGQEISDHLLSAYTDNLQNISMQADLYVVAVSDAAIASVAAALNIQGKIIVHTAGSVPKDVLNTGRNSYGVIYPLQTLSNVKTTLPVVPVLVDGETNETLEKLISFCVMWADNVQVANDDQRLKMHIAAVLSTNFTNHLYALSEQLCGEEALDFKLLQPLITETMNRLSGFSPRQVQTGPARRRDLKTIELHLRSLEQQPRLYSIYKTMTESILEMYSKEGF